MKSSQNRSLGLFAQASGSIPCVAAMGSCPCGNKTFPVRRRELTGRATCRWSAPGASGRQHRAHLRVDTFWWSASWSRTVRERAGPMLGGRRSPAAAGRSPKIANVRLTVAQLRTSFSRRDLKCIAHRPFPGEIAQELHKAQRLAVRVFHFLPLHLESRAAVDTACAAHHLSRRPQTLRGWACHEDGPIRPIRINGRLAWPVAELRRVLGVAAPAR